MVQFQSRFDEKAANSLYKRQVGKLIWFFVLLSVILTVAGAFYLSEDLETGIFFIVFGILFTPLFLWIMRMVRKQYYRSISILNSETEEIYCFDENSIHIIQKKGEEYYGEITAKYSYIYRIEETDETYFLYISSQSSHVIPKSALVEGSLEELKSYFRLNLPEKKYKEYRKK